MNSSLALGASAGATLDLKGNMSVGNTSAITMNPGGGVVLLDGVTLSNHSINSSGPTTSGLFKVTNASSLNNIAFSTGNGANLEVDAVLSTSNMATLNATNVTVGGTGGLNLQGGSGSMELTTQNLTMAKGSTLDVGGSHDGISLTGNFSFQETNPLNWTHGATTGLGPDLTMTGGSMATPVTLEVGGVNDSYHAAGFSDNFALDGLTVGTTGAGGSGYVELVDQYANATPSGWTSGSEALYLDHLYGFSTTSYGTLNLDDIHAYLQGYGALRDGLFTDSNGDLVNIIGAPVPEPSTWAMVLAGFSSLFLAGALRRRKSAIAMEL